MDLIVSRKLNPFSSVLYSKYNNLYISSGNKVIWIGAAHYEGEWIWTNGNRMSIQIL